MVRKLIIVVLTVAFVTATSLAFAADVFVTKAGKKYHKGSCQLIKNKETSQVDDADAIKQGYVPCAKCHKVSSDKQVAK